MNYTKPTIVDHGSLQRLTAACLGGSGGDAFTGGYSATVGVSNPAVGCRSS